MNASYTHWKSSVDCGKMSLVTGLPEVAQNPTADPGPEKNEKPAAPKMPLISSVPSEASRAGYLELGVL